MKLRNARIAGLAAWLLAVPVVACAAEPSIGRQEYDAHCAAYHGRIGRGDGWLATHLMQPVPSLTNMQKNNGGVFPFERVYAVIDGRTEVRLHGPRTMPIWGDVFRLESDRAAESSLWRLHTGESFVRARILALIEHLSGLQE